MLQLQTNLNGLSEFGLNPRDWLLADPANKNETVVRLLHRDDEEILLKVEFRKTAKLMMLNS